MKRNSWLLFLVLFSLMGSYPMAQTWTQLSTMGGPPAERVQHTAVYDATNNRMTIFGGYTTGTFFNDVWVLSNAN